MLLPAKRETVTHNHGTSILGLLGVAFVVLKLTGYIDWSWWLVTLPFWGGIAAFAVAVFIVWIMLIIEEKTDAS